MIRNKGQSVHKIYLIIAYIKYTTYWNSVTMKTTASMEEIISELYTEGQKLFSPLWRGHSRVSLPLLQ